MSFWDWVPTLIDTGVQVWGAEQAMGTQKEVADITSASREKELEYKREATQAEQEAIAVAQRNLQEQQAQASPGLMQIQKVIGRGEELTPVQVRGIEEARRRTIDALQGGSLRGSARATAETVGAVEGKMREDFIEQNRRQADIAAANLSGQYFNAGKNVADLSLAKGTSASRGLMGAAASEAEAGGSQAATTQNISAIQGRAIGDIGAVIAEEVKKSTAEKRDSSYKTIGEDI